jgi:hypothetical protein
MHWGTRKSDYDKASEARGMKSLYVSGIRVGREEPARGKLEAIRSDHSRWKAQCGIAVLERVAEPI